MPGQSVANNPCNQCWPALANLLIRRALRVVFRGTSCEVRVTATEPETPGAFLGRPEHAAHPTESIGWRSRTGLALCHTAADRSNSPSSVKVSHYRQGLLPKITPRQNPQPPPQPLLFQPPGASGASPPPAPDSHAWYSRAGRNSPPPARPHPKKRAEMAKVSRKSPDSPKRIARQLKQTSYKKMALLFQSTFLHNPCPIVHTRPSWTAPGAPRRRHPNLTCPPHSVTLNRRFFFGYIRQPRQDLLPYRQDRNAATHFHIGIRYRRPSG